jgi:hypothetical protein
LLRRGTVGVILMERQKYRKLLVFFVAHFATDNGNSDEIRVATALGTP